MNDQDHITDQDIEALSDEITCPITQKTFQKRIPKKHWVELGYATTKDYKKYSGLMSLISPRNAAKRSAAMKKTLKDNPDLSKERGKNLSQTLQAKTQEERSAGALKRWANTSEEEKREIMSRGFHSPESRKKAGDAVKENWASLTPEERERRGNAISEATQGRTPWNKGLTAAEDERVAKSVNTLLEKRVIDYSYTQTPEYREKMSKVITAAIAKFSPDERKAWARKSQQSRIANGTPLQGGNGKKCTVRHQRKDFLLLSWGEYDFFMLLREFLDHKAFSPNTESFDTPYGHYTPDFWVKTVTDKVYIEIKGRPDHVQRSEGTSTYAQWFKLNSVSPP